MSLQEFVAGFLGAGVTEIIASISGFICIYLLVKRNIWCWFFGFIQVTLFTYVFYDAKLYSDAGLHVIYIALQIYGWWNWRTKSDHNNELIVETGNVGHFALWWTVVAISTIALGFMMTKYTDASFAYADAFTTCASLVAQFLLTRRYWVNWVFWIIVDFVAIYIYTQKGLYPTAVLYFTFLVMSFAGLFAWLKQAKQQSLQPVNG